MQNRLPAFSNLISNFLLWTEQAEMYYIGLVVVVIIFVTRIEILDMMKYHFLAWLNKLNCSVCELYITK